jgi:hypothetical protein
MTPKKRELAYYLPSLSGLIEKLEEILSPRRPRPSTLRANVRG